MPSLKEHYAIMMDAARMSREINAGTIYCGAERVWSSQSSVHQFDEYDKVLCNTMSAYRRAGAIAIHLNDYFMNNHEKMFGETYAETNWHINNTPSAMADMAALYFDLRRITRYLEDYEFGEQYMEEQKYC